MKKRTVLAALIIIVSLGIYSQRGDIALGILPAAMEANLSTNKIEELGDGLHIGLCGAGGPMPAATRSGPCVVVVAAGKLFMLDAGSNGIRNMGRMGFDIGQIEGVFLTHFHSDHIDGLGEVATLRWAGSCSGPTASSSARPPRSSTTSSATTSPTRILPTGGPEATRSS